ncbi:MAG TPA: Calx-beta domain-containing protein, partial [Pyrinomonadaceae bacterium]
MLTTSLRRLIFTTLLPACAVGLIIWVGVVLAETPAASRRIQAAAGGGPSLLTPRAALTPSLQFSNPVYGAGEGDGSVTVNVNRSGDESVAASVDFATAGGTASDRTDYTASLGTLHFAAGERSKSFAVLITDDGSVEGSETVSLTLSNPRGASLGDLCAVTLTLFDNDAATPATNPIDSAQFFVRQHYLDFLNREPDASGLQFWTNDLNACGADAACLEARKVNVSAAFFLSIEFQETGYLIYRAYQAAYGRRVKSAVPLTLRELLPDTQAIGRGVVVGAPGWAQRVEANQQAFFDDFVLRPQFLSAYPTTVTSSAFVDSLNANTGGSLSQSERDALISGLDSGTKSRAQALRSVCDDADFSAREKNRAFVLMQYYGYLRRNPDDAPEQNRDFSGYQFWLSKLEQFGGNFVRAEMVKAFLVSVEYRSRFVEDAKPNQPPAVNAGTDLTITLPETASLSGVVSDDGLPSVSSLSALWGVVSGPGAVNFGAPASATTTASFSAPGTYVLKLTASDTLLAAEDT